MNHKENESKKEQLRAYLSLPWRVALSDGRLIEGKCICLDHACNLILKDAKETRQDLGETAFSDGV